MAIRTTKEEYERELAELTRLRSELSRLRAEYNEKWDRLRRIVANIRYNEARLAELTNRLEALRRIGWTRLKGVERAEYARLRDLLIPEARNRIAHWVSQRDAVVAEIYRETPVLRQLEQAIRTEENRIRRKIIVLYYTLTITINKPEWGTTVPPPSVYYHPEGTTVEVKSVPTKGYMLEKWLLDGTELLPTETYTVIMDRDHTLTAVFTEAKNKLIAMHKRWKYKSPRKGHDISIEAVANMVIEPEKRKEDYEEELKSFLEEEMYAKEGFERLTELEEKVEGFEERPTSQPPRPPRLEKLEWWHAVFTLSQLKLTDFLPME